MKPNSLATLVLNSEQAESLEWFLAERLQDWHDYCEKDVADDDESQEPKTIQTVENVQGLLQAAMRAAKPIVELYFVQASNDDGVDLSLFVYATSYDQAKQLWQAHYFEGDKPECEPTGIGIVPKGTGVGAVQWEGVK